MGEPAPWQAVLVVAALAASVGWVAAWRAGDSWRNWSGVVAFAGFAAPWLQWGFQIDGLHGVVVGYLLALMLAGQITVATACLVVMVGTLVERNYVRVATRTQGAIVAQYLLVASLVGLWNWVAWFVGWLALTAAADVVLRPGGWWERHGDPWLQRHDGVGVAIQGLGMTAYPALVVWWLHQAPPFLRHLADGTAAAIPADNFSVEWLFLGWFALWMIPFGLAVGLHGRSETRQALAAGVPFTVWALLAVVLRASAPELATFGLVWSALLGIGTWAGVVLRSKAVDDKSDRPSWVAEGRAMVYVGPPSKRS